MDRLVLGLLFAVWTFAAAAAESEQDVVRLTVDLLSIQPVSVQGENPRLRLSPNRFIASIELANTPVAPVHGFVISGARGAAAELKKEAAWAARSGWQMISGDDRPSLSALLRFGSPGKEFKIRPRRHAIRIEYIQNFD